jgi:hypothetical protein
MQEDSFNEDQRRALDASRGGEARAKKLTPEERKETAKKAAKARWAKSKAAKEEKTFQDVPLQNSPFVVSLKASSPQDMDKSLAGFSTADVVQVSDTSMLLPKAIFWGSLDLMSKQMPCYVLDNGQRIIGRTAANEMLTGIKGAGDFESTISVKSLKPFLNSDEIINQLVPFSLPDVEGLGRDVKGMPADVFIDVCRAFVNALEASYNKDQNITYPTMTDRQKEIAIQASIFLASVAKVGLDALIDEATGYQEVRERDALQVKLRAYLEDEMRKWEKTFPDELWMEFGRLTNWKGSIHKRPKYWGKLVMELIYEYLDSDIAQWLRENAPKPRGGQNYHQWLSAQYGLQKLVQHIWQVVGMAKSCDTIAELKQKMAENFGTGPVQLTMKLPRS